MQYKMKFSIVLIIFYLSLKFTESVDCDHEPKNNEVRLKQALLCKYDKTNRPVLDEKLPIIIKVRLIVKGFDFTDYNLKLTIISWLSMAWIDDHLKWDPREYNGLDSITENGEEIWQPQLGVYNSDIDSISDEPCKTQQCRISSTGDVACIPPCSHSASCESNFEDWPYDTQNCSIHLGTWVNSGEEINFNVHEPKFDGAELISQNQEWKLIQIAYRRNPGNYTNSKIRYDNTYPSVTYSFTMERHTAVHAAVLIGPSIMLLVINLISLWLDPGCSERFTVNGLALLVHFLYMQQLSWFVPKDGDRCPNIIIHFRDSLIISGILLINTVILRGITYWQRTIPQWIETTITIIATNRIGEIFLTQNLIERKPFDNNSTDDNVTLVESQTPSTVTENTVTAKQQNQLVNSTWKTLVKIIDRIMFIIIFTTYLIMVFKFIPMGYRKNSTLYVVGY